MSAPWPPARSGTSRWWPRNWRRSQASNPIRRNMPACRAAKAPYRYLPHFLGSGQPATFHLTRYPGCSSLLTPDPKVIDLFMTIGCADPGGNFHVEKTETIDTVRLDDIKPALLVDFLKVDAQGYELEIMRHGTTGACQHAGDRMRGGVCPAVSGSSRCSADVQCFLRDRGFMLHKLIDVAGRPFRPFNPPNPHIAHEPVAMGRRYFRQGLHPSAKTIAMTNCSRPPRSWMWFLSLLRPGGIAAD